MAAAALQRRRAAFYVLLHQHDQEPDEHFVDPASRLYEEMLATLPALPPRRAQRFRDQLEFWPVRTRELALSA